jgi:hypothetical protein
VDILAERFTAGLRARADGVALLITTPPPSAWRGLPTRSAVTLICVGWTPTGSTAACVFCRTPAG